jgi:hypothetical protein
VGQGDLCDAELVWGQRRFDSQPFEVSIALPNSIESPPPARLA